MARETISDHHLIGRKLEKQILLRARDSLKSEFLAVYGRRRIGKTYLIREFFKESSFYFEFTGTKNVPSRIQIKNFTQELIRLADALGLGQSFEKSITKSKPKTWQDSLEELRKLIEQLPQKSNSRKIKKILFFDELPWIASRKSGFVEALDYFWNSFLSKRTDFILIVCGSAANWMISEVVNHRGGLHNRITCPPLAMAPFNLRETREYLNMKGMDLNLEMIAEIYMVTGGVAYYLDQIHPGESAGQFINRSVFGQQGELRFEFDRLFQSLFDQFEVHIKIVKELAKVSSGLTYPQIASRVKVETGGTFSKILAELEKSSFIQMTPKLGNKKKDGIYRLVDEFALFYLTWVEPLGRGFQDANYWQKQIGKPRHNTWLGHAFENLCFKHTDQIKMALGISGLTTYVFEYHNSKIQIDMIIDRSDKCMNLCEMKYSYSPFQMTLAEGNKIKARKEAILNDLKRKKQIFITLVTPFPAKRNSHYLGVIDHEINLESLF